MLSAVRRSQLRREERAGMGDVQEQLTRENKIRAIVGKGPQAIGPKKKRPPFQR
jgi:hypothetical protein